MSGVVLRRARRLLHRPLVHFLAGGALLFAVARDAPAPHPDAAVAPPIVLGADDVARLVRDYARDTGLEPSVADEIALIDAAVEEELLYREALARGLDRDRSVRNWLVEQMRALEGDDDADSEELYGRALALGLDRSDLVVRRLLVQKMRLLVARENERPPSDDELRAYYEAQADDYAIAERVTFWHLFSSDPSAAVARRRLAKLRRDGATPGAARGGETFAAPPYLRAQSAADVARRFGADFAAALAGLPQGEWSGPVASAYGWHLVWIEERTARQRPPLAAVRGQLTERWLAEQRARRVEATLRRLAGNYQVQVESPAWRQRGRS